MYKPTFIYQYLATFTALLGIITSGMHYAWPSPSLPKLLSNTSNTAFHITSDEGAWIAITQLLVAMVSCVLGAIVVDLLGRKLSIICTALPFFASWLLVVFATSSKYLFLARALAGLADGITFTAVPVYVGEISHPKIRGFLGSSISGSFTLGMLLINILGSFLTIPTTAAIASTLPLVLLVTFVWMPESPYFYIMKGRFEEARRSLVKLRGEDVEEELERLKSVIAKNQEEEKGRISDLWMKKGNRKGLFVLVIIRNAQQLSGNAAITFYAYIIFKESSDFFSPTTATIVFFTVQWLVGILCSIVIDKTGRRPLLITSLSGTCLTLFTLGTFFYVKTCTEIDTKNFSFIPVAALIIYVVVFNLGCQPIPLLMQGELFPTSVKGAASSFSEIYFSIMGAIMSKFFQVVKDEIGMFVPFWVFAAMCVVNLVLVVIFLPETKGRTLEEIQQKLRE